MEHFGRYLHIRLGQSHHEKHPMDTQETQSGRRVRRAAIAATVAVPALSAALLAGAAPSFATTPYTHNNAYSYSIVRQSAAYDSSSELAELSNNTNVSMICYTDGQDVTDRNYSNYNSARWFKIHWTIGNGGTGYIHSSYVQSQITVGHC